MNALSNGIEGARAMWHRQTPVLRGIVLMCLSTVAFSIMHGLVRFVSEVLPPFQIAFSEIFSAWRFCCRF